MSAKTLTWNNNGTRFTITAQWYIDEYVVPKPYSIADAECIVRYQFNTNTTLEDEALRKAKQYEP